MTGYCTIEKHFIIAIFLYWILVLCEKLYLIIYLINSFNYHNTFPLSIYCLNFIVKWIKAKKGKITQRSPVTSGEIWDSLSDWIQKLLFSVAVFENLYQIYLTVVQLMCRHQYHKVVIKFFNKRNYNLPNFIYLLSITVVHTLCFCHFLAVQDWEKSIYFTPPQPSEKAMAPHSSTSAWKIPWMEEPGRLQSMGLWRVGHDWATSLSLFTFTHWRRKWQPTPVFLPGESQGPGSLVGSVYGVVQSQTRLKRLSSSSSSMGWRWRLTASTYSVRSNGSQWE